MIDTLKTLLRIVSAILPTLRRFYGWSWPVALVRNIFRGRSLVRSTRWAERDDAEARYVRALSVLPAIALDLRHRLGENAPQAVRELATAALEANAGRVARAGGLAQISNPSERWHTFFDVVVTQGIGVFNETECLTVQPDRFHVRVQRCLFAALTAECAIPELAQATCDSSHRLCQGLLDSHEFHRDGSAERTLAYGHSFCDYVWERRQKATTLAGAGSATDVHPVVGQSVATSCASDASAPAQ